MTYEVHKVLGKLIQKESTNVKSMTYRFHMDYVFIISCIKNHLAFKIIATAYSYQFPMLKLSIFINSQNLVAKLSFKAGETGISPIIVSNTASESGLLFITTYSCSGIVSSLENLSCD